MSGFSVDWLDLREPADRRARDAGLLRRAAQWLQAAERDEVTVVDLGAGTGATLRAFAGLSAATEPAPLWRLIDQDAALLAEAEHRHGREITLETRTLDLSDLDALPLAGARLVCASALFDLVSAGFVDSLARRLQTRPVGLYAALNYDGTTRWEPGHRLDDAVLAAFNRDQRRDKGFGPALGPDSGACLERRFRELGYRVYTADSPWILDGHDRDLVAALIDGIGKAVEQDPALRPAALEDWLQFRRLCVGEGTCHVGHLDFLALPDRAAKQ